MNKLLAELKERLHIVIFLLPLPCLYLLFSFYQTTQELNLLEERIELAEIKTSASQTQKLRQEAILKSISLADHFFVDKYLESLTFLESEVSSLRALASSSTGAQKRLSFLEKNNKLLFSEENKKSVGNLIEVEEVQRHPIEVDEEDLKKLLSLIDCVQIGAYSPVENSPQFLVKHFSLTKKAKNTSENVFVLNMSLLKREPK